MCDHDAWNQDGFCLSIGEDILRPRIVAADLRPSQWQHGSPTSSCNFGIWSGALAWSLSPFLSALLKEYNLRCETIFAFLGISRFLDPQAHHQITVWAAMFVCKLHAGIAPTTVGSCRKRRCRRWSNIVEWWGPPWLLILWLGFFLDAGEIEKVLFHYGSLS